jgi:sigma-54 dependent transcriptional regulator, flagellar regulatory protein
MQVKLLRVLQERSFERVGSNRTIDCNVRIIAATHRDLDAAMLEGRFREDLYYRLNVFPVEMPPLRDRLDDLPVLIEHLVQRQSESSGRRIQFDSAAMHSLARNRWPGNVRELANLLERLAILFPSRTITAADLPERYRCEAVGWTAAPPAAPPVELPVAPAVSDEPAVLYEMVGTLLPRGGIDLKDHLSAIEMGLIRKALAEADGTVAEAARLLRIRRTTLVEKLRKYRLGALTIN